MWVSPLSKSLLGGMDISSFSGPLFAGGLYYLYWRMTEKSRAQVFPANDVQLAE